MTLLSHTRICTSEHLLHDSSAAVEPMMIFINPFMSYFILSDNLPAKKKFILEFSQNYTTTIYIIQTNFCYVCLQLDDQRF